MLSTVCSLWTLRPQPWVHTVSMALMAPLVKLLQRSPTSRVGQNPGLFSWSAYYSQGKQGNNRSLSGSPLALKVPQEPGNEINCL